MTDGCLSAAVLTVLIMGDVLESLSGQCTLPDRLFAEWALARQRTPHEQRTVVSD
jgi:hypothetical protein